MLVDLRSLDAPAELTGDLCIVGAGAAGITLAHLFAGSDLRVVLVESGGLEPDEATQELYRGRDVGVRSSPLTRSRLRYFGGSTNHWNGWCAPADRLDLEARAWIPGSGWPLAYDDLLPGYERARRLLGLDPLPLEGKDPPVATLPFGSERAHMSFWQIDHPPTRFGSALRDRLERAPNVVVLLWANAIGLERAADRDAVERVELATLGGRRARVRARRFVLACGALENARLLLASNRVERAGLGNRHDNVGRYFTDHFQLELGPLYALDPTRFALLRQRRGPSGVAYRPGLCLAADLQRREQVANAVAFLAPRRRRALGHTGDDPEQAATERRVLDQLAATLAAPVAGSATGTQAPGPSAAAGEAAESDAAVTPAHDPGYHAADAGAGRDAEAEVTSMADDAGDGGVGVSGDGEGAILRMYGNPLPDRESRVRLGAQRDALGMPRLEVDWRLGERDRRCARVLAETLGAELYRVGAGRLRLASWLRAGSGADWLEGVSGAQHPMGTTRMSVDPRHGVTDPHGRVHGMENLYVAGSSLFPNAIRVNPTLTLLALAFRLADHLAAELGAPAPRRV